MHRPIVPSSRPAVGFTRGHEYDIDVREFLVTENNALIQETIRQHIPAYIGTLPGGDMSLFRSRTKSSFDYRANVIAAYVSETISYESKKGRDPWQFPDETIHLRSGDCEDRAFLIASLLMGAGISSYNLRVALGKVRTTDDTGHTKEHDHMWVMYKNEAGQWTLIEPLKVVAPPKSEGKRSMRKRRAELEQMILKPLTSQAEYRPSFLFNDSHLWAVANHGVTQEFDLVTSLRKKWKKIDPKFVGEVHRTILRAALAGFDQRIVQALEVYFTRAIGGLIGPIVDDIDRRKYNPLDHFDNGYISEGWDLVDERLRKFSEHNSRYLDSFALAAHGIADFYAHSSYAHFAKLKRRSRDEFDFVQLYEPANVVQIDQLPDYTAASQFDLTSGQFTINEEYWRLNGRSRQQIAERWKGKIISGRYAQKRDTQPGLINLLLEGPTRIPDEFLYRRNTQGKPDFPDRGSLPHHNEIAVDEEDRSDEHKLYSDTRNGRFDRMSYRNQFIWRRNAAIRHIRKAFKDNWNLSKAEFTPLP